MEHFDIETYLEGGLSGAALAAFEAEMRSNPGFAQQVKLMHQLTGDLEMQSLRNEVKTILQSDSSGQHNNQKPTRWLGLLAGVAVLCIAGYFLMGETQNDVAPSITPTEKQAAPTNDPAQTPATDKNETPPETTPETKDKPPTNKQPETKQSRPIADNNAPSNLALPIHPSPNVRGQNDDNAAWKEMLDKIWYTDFPPANASFQAPFAEAAQLLIDRDFKKAFVKLEMLEMKSPANDTLRFLKGYCLLEMGEGGDANRYFDQMENPPEDWQGHLEWYRALGVLISKGMPDAVPAFKKMASDPTHLFRQQSAKAVEVLEE